MKFTISVYETEEEEEKKHFESQIFIIDVPHNEFQLLTFCIKIITIPYFARKILYNRSYTCVQRLIL